MFFVIDIFRHKFYTCKTLKKSLAIISSTFFFCYADNSNCQALYNDFMETLEIQLTELCETTTEGFYSYRFYLRDQDGYQNMRLVFGPLFRHLYIEGEENPFVCDKDKIAYRTQKPEEIVEILFSLRDDCQEDLLSPIPPRQPPKLFQGGPIKHPSRASRP